MPVAGSYAAVPVHQAEGGVSSLDMASLMLCAYELGDWINASAEVADYLYWKQQVWGDPEAAERQKHFLKVRETFEECQRFGRFHPDYHAAKDAMKEAEGRLNELESVRRYKAAEQIVDEMLHEVSELIARSVSETIKVPGNEKATGGCGSGGACGCGSGGCG